MKKTFIFWLALILTPLIVWAASTGWTNPAAASNYTNSNNCFTSNNSYATYSWLGDGSTYLQAGDFSFSFTNFSSLDGIEVSVEHYYSNSSGITHSYDIYKDSDSQWLSQPMKGAPTTEQYISAGNSSYDWNPTSAWTLTDLEKLVVRISSTRSGGLGGCIHYVDHIRVDITYTQTGGSQLKVNGISDWTKINGITVANVAKINGITNN